MKDENMKTSSIVSDKRKESFDLNKCIICQKSGSLVSTISTDFKNHMDNKCCKN